MYIFGYHYNQSFYDIYDYDWANRDLWQYYEPPPVRTDSFGSSLPIGWSTNEKSIAPLGADRSPPWHQASVPPRAYGGFSVNGLPGNLFAWENKDNPINSALGGDRINYYNNNIRSSVVIAETHLLFTHHVLVFGSPSDGGFPENDGIITQYFMNPSGEMFLVTCKRPSEMTRSATNPNPDNGSIIGFTPEEIRSDRTFPSYPQENPRDYDILILEIDKIEKMVPTNNNRLGWQLEGSAPYASMTAAGIPPITKFAKIRSSDNYTVPKEPFPLWTLDNQGRCVVSYNSWSPTDTRLAVHPYFALKRNDNPNGRTANTDYVLPYRGDSGSSTWINTVEHGFVYAYEADGAEFIQDQDELDALLDVIYIEGLDQIEFIDLNEVTIKYEWEHPDIDYKSTDNDNETLVPVLGNNSVRVESSFVDDNNEDINYNVESNSIDVEFNNTKLIEPGSFKTDFTDKINFNQETIYTDVPPLGINFLINNPDNADLRLYSIYTDSIDSYRHPSNKDSIIQVKLLADGEEAELINLFGDRVFNDTLFDVKLNPSLLNLDDTTEDGYVINHYFNVETRGIDSVSGERGFFADKNFGESFDLTIQVSQSDSTDDPATINIGTITKSAPPLGVAVEYDASEIYPGNVVDFTITTTNTPIPDDVSFISPEDSPGAFIFYPENFPNAPKISEPVNCSIQSNTQKTLKVLIDGSEDDRINLKLFYYWAVNDPTNVGGQFPYSFTLVPNDEGVPEVGGFIEIDAVIIEESATNPATNLRLELENDDDLYSGNENINLKLRWDGTDVNPVPSFIESISFSTLPFSPSQYFSNLQYIDAETISVDLSSETPPGTQVQATAINAFNGPYNTETVEFSGTVFGVPTIVFTDDSTEENYEAAIGDTILLEAELDYYIGGTITASISIDGSQVASETITNAQELAGDVYSLSYVVTEDDIDRPTVWSYTISASNPAGDSLVQTRSGSIEQIPTIFFTNDSTDDGEEVTVGDEILLEANLDYYIEGSITASINIDGNSVVSETITDATELDSDIYSLTYVVTQDDIDQNVAWSYSIVVGNSSGFSPFKTRSGTIKQLPRINVNPTTTAPGVVLTNGDNIVIDVNLVNMDANGTATANIVVDGDIVETTTLTSGESSLNLTHTVANIESDTTWSLDVTLTNDFDSVGVFYSTEGTVDVLETPTIIVNDAVSTSGTIVRGNTIVLEATIGNYNSVEGSITINGIDTGASGTLTGDLYRIEYTTTQDEVDSTANWVSSITAFNASESITATRDGSIFVSTEDVPLLEVGTLLPGQWTDTEQPDSYSDGGDHPADQETLPIARWNIIPMRVVPSGGFEIGVVAFHANGIDRVEFQANGGSVAIVNEMTLNTRTGNREYSVNLNMSSGDQLVELRAIVYPKFQGKPFVLQNSEFSYQDTAEEFSRPDYLGSPDHLFTLVNTLTFEIPDDEGGPPEIRDAAPTVLSEGQHSMFLWGPNKYSDAPTLYVTPSTGSSDGPGTIDQPYDTLKNAWNENKTSLRNATIILTEPGRYDMRHENNGMNNGNDNDGWATIAASPELNQQVFEDRVILYNSGEDGETYNPGRIKSKAIHFKNLCFEATAMKFIMPGMGDGTYFWFDNTYHTDDEGRFTTNPRFSSGLVNSNQKRIALYVDGALFYDRRKSCGGCMIVRNTEFHKSADTDIYSISSMVLDCTVHDSEITPDSDAHMDIWQWTGGQKYNETYIDVRNKICFGLRGWDQHDMQPMILDQTRSAFYGIAIVDFACDRQESSQTHGINFESYKDHVIMSNCAFDQFLKFDGTYNNSLLQNTTWNDNNSETAYKYSLPSGLWAKNCLNKNGNSLEGDGNPTDEGRWENILQADFTLEHDGTDLRLSGPGWDLAEALGGVPLPGFNDDPPIGHFQINDQPPVPILNVKEESTPNGEIEPGTEIKLKVEILNEYSSVVGFITVNDVEKTTEVTNLGNDEYEITFTTDSDPSNPLEQTTWKSSITATNENGSNEARRQGTFKPEEFIPADRTPGIYEKDVYTVAGILDINAELESRSDWNDYTPNGKYDIQFGTLIRENNGTVTTVNGQVIDWMNPNNDSDLNALIAMSDTDFESHLRQFKDRWRDQLADNIRIKQDNGTLVMDEIDLYNSDPEVKMVDDKFSFEFHLAAYYQYAIPLGLEVNTNQLENGLYFNWNDDTNKATATEKANIFVNVWLKELYEDLISNENSDLKLEGKFSQFNLPYRYPTNSLNVFNKPIFTDYDEDQRKDFILNVFNIQYGENSSASIENLDHETIRDIYNKCGTFSDFFPPTYATDIRSWRAYFSAFSEFGLPRKNTTMAQGQFNDSGVNVNNPCSSWKYNEDLVNKPYYSVDDFYVVPGSSDNWSATSFWQIPVSVWIYLQEFIVENTDINLCRFWSFGPDNALFNPSGTNAENIINTLNIQLSDYFGVPHSYPPTETNKVNHSLYRAYGQWHPDKTYTVRDLPPPTVNIDDEVSTPNGNITAGDTIVLQATAQDYDTVSGFIIVDSILRETAVQNLGNDTYKIEYTTESDILEQVTWSAGIVANNTTDQSASVGRSGNVIPQEEEVDPPVVTSVSPTTTGDINEGDSITLTVTVQNNDTPANTTVTGSITIDEDIVETTVVQDETDLTKYSITYDTSNYTFNQTAPWTSKITVTNSVDSDEVQISGIVNVIPDESFTDTIDDHTEVDGNVVYVTDDAGGSGVDHYLLENNNCTEIYIDVTPGSNTGRLAFSNGTQGVDDFIETGKVLKLQSPGGIVHASNFVDGGNVVNFNVDTNDLYNSNSDNYSPLTAKVVSEPGEEQFLIPGNINIPNQKWAEKTQPSSYSDGGEHPADSETLPIARWNVIPMQVANRSDSVKYGETGNSYEGFPIGVVAFHANGIDRVEFESNGGDIVTVTQMSINPRTGNREFWVNLQADNLGEQLIEIRATVYPYKQGKPFVLQNVKCYGEMENTLQAYQDYEINDYENDYEVLQQRVSPAFYVSSGNPRQLSSVIGEGEHSMFLWGPDKFANAKSLYVDPDYTGTSNGTETQPYKRLEDAWDDLNNTSGNGFDGAEIVLMKPRSDNTYGLEKQGGGNLNGGSSTAGWFTIRGGLEFAPDGQTWEAKDFVVGPSTDYVGGTRPVIRLSPKKFRFKDICLRAGSEGTNDTGGTHDNKGDVQYVIPNGNYTMLWFDGIYSFDKKGRLTAESRGSGLVNSNQFINATFATNCTFFDKRKGSGGCTIIRNCSFDKSADTDQYSNSAMVLDCTSSRIRISDSVCREFYQSYPPNLHSETIKDENNNNVPNPEFDPNFVIPIDYSPDTFDYDENGNRINVVVNGKKDWPNVIPFDDYVNEEGEHLEHREVYREYCSTSGVTGLFYRQLVDGEYFIWKYPLQKSRYQPLIDEIFLEWNDNPPSGVSPSGRYSETEDIQRIYGYRQEILLDDEGDPILDEDGNEQIIPGTGWQPGDDYPSKEEFEWLTAEDFGNSRYSLQYYYDDDGVDYKKPGDTVDNGCPHIDVWQLTGGSDKYKYKKNQICFGVHAWDVNDTQPMLLDQSRSNHNRIAIVDFSCEANKDGPDGINLETGGPFNIWKPKDVIANHPNSEEPDPTAPPNGRVGLDEPSSETRGYSIVEHMVMLNCSFNVFVKAGRARHGAWHDGGPGSSNYGNSAGLFANSLIQNTTMKSFQSFDNHGEFNMSKGEPNTGLWLMNCVFGNSNSNISTNGSRTASDGTGTSKWENIIVHGPFVLTCEPERLGKVIYDAPFELNGEVLRGVPIPGLNDDPPIGSFRVED